MMYTKIESNSSLEHCFCEVVATFLPCEERLPVLSAHLLDDDGIEHVGVMRIVVPISLAWLRDLAMDLLSGNVPEEMLFISERHLWFKGAKAEHEAAVEDERYEAHLPPLKGDERI